MSRVSFGADRIPVHILSAPSDEEQAWEGDAALVDQVERFGWAVRRKVISEDACAAVRRAFDESVKRYDGPLLRQETVRMQPHELSADDGFMVNAILGVQDLIDEAFGAFRRSSLDVLAHSDLRRALELLIGEPPALIESMYFESSKGTSAHADLHFMDSSNAGTMVGVWFALEDIHPDAGRFFVVPRSHLLGTDASELAGLRDLFARYEALRLETSRTFAHAGRFANAGAMVEMGRLKRALLDPEVLPVIAPAMFAGDVLFWSAGTLHGSVRPEARGRSRSSLTAHYIGRSHGYRRYGAPVALDYADWNGMPVHHSRPDRV